MQFFKHNRPTSNFQLPSSILHLPSSILYLLSFTLLFVFLLTAVWVSPAQAHHGSDITPADVAFDQNLNEQIPLNLGFVNEAGETVQLGNYLGQKPAILVLAYYECENLCDVVLNGLVESLKDINLSVGDQFNIITVSIDPREAPDLAMTKKDTLIQTYGRPGAAEGWHFLTGKQAAIEQLAKTVGIKYVYDEEADQYAHPAGIMLLTSQGQIARYLYGIEYPSTDLRLGLVEASQNKIGSPVDQLLLLCYHYDPATGQYSLLITNVIRLAGLLTVAAMGAMLFVMFRREPKDSKEGEDYGKFAAIS